MLLALALALVLALHPNCLPMEEKEAKRPAVVVARNDPQNDDPQNDPNDTQNEPNLNITFLLNYVKLFEIIGII